MISGARVFHLVVGIVLGLAVQVATAADWQIYQAKAYGFSMLVPGGVAVKEQEWPGGWGGLRADFDGVKLYGRAKLGAQATDPEIEKFAVQIIGIPAGQWRIIDSGANQNGWLRYRAFEAVSGPRLFFGGYGVGAKGNYLLYLETTVTDYNQHRADYRKWYESIRLD